MAPSKGLSKIEREAYRKLLKWSWVEMLSSSVWVGLNIYQTYAYAMKGSFWCFFWGFLLMCSLVWAVLSGLQVSYLQDRLEAGKASKNA